jgi:hypothetical protein
MLYSGGVLYVCHRNFLNNSLEARKGGADFIFNKFNDREILEISHDEFTELNQSIILFSDFKENKKKIIKIAKFKKFPLIIFSFIKLWYILNFIKKKNYLYLLNSDCFLASVSIFFNKIFFLKKKIIFHITDYTPKRFAYKIFNSLYLSFFYFALKYSDYRTCPSLKIINYFSKYKIYFIPNSPIFRSRVKFVKNKSFNIILSLVKIDDGTNWDLLLDVFTSLKKFIPDYNLFITGIKSSPFSKNIINRFKSKNLINNVHFVDYINSKKKLDDFYDRSVIGLTAYRKTIKHNYWEYGDSIKIREYANKSLVILTEGNFQNTSEVVRSHCGFSYYNKKDLLIKLLRLNKNKYLIKKMSINSRNWANQNNKFKFLDKFFKEIIIS